MDEARPIGAGVDSQRVCRIGVTEHIWSVFASALQGQEAGQIILLDSLIQTRLQIVLVCRANRGNLKVVARTAREVRHWIKGKQRFGTGIDLGCRQQRTLGGGGNERGFGQCVAIVDPLITDEESGSVVDQVRNLEGAAEADDARRRRYRRAWVCFAR